MQNERTNNFTSRQVLFHNELHVRDFHLIATWTISNRYFIKIYSYIDFHFK